MDKIRCTDIIEGQLGRKKAVKRPEASYTILIEQQLQRHKNVNDCNEARGWIQGQNVL